MKICYSEKQLVIINCDCLGDQEIIEKNLLKLSLTSLSYCQNIHVLSLIPKFLSVIRVVFN